MICIVCEKEAPLDDPENPVATFHGGKYAKHWACLWRQMMEDVGKVTGW